MGIYLSNKQHSELCKKVLAERFGEAIKISDIDTFKKYINSNAFKDKLQKEFVKNIKFPQKVGKAEFVKLINGDGDVIYRIGDKEFRIRAWLDGNFEGLEYQTGLDKCTFYPSHNSDVVEDDDADYESGTLGEMIEYAGSMLKKPESKSKRFNIPQGLEDKLRKKVFDGKNIQGLLNQCEEEIESYYSRNNPGKNEQEEHTGIDQVGMNVDIYSGFFSKMYEKTGSDVWKLLHNAMNNKKFCEEFIDKLAHLGMLGWKPKDIKYYMANEFSANEDI